MALGGFTGQSADDRAFFRACASAMAIVLVGGFVLQLGLGRSSFSAPLTVHLHAATFMAWVGITLAQVWLAASGARKAHAALGKAATLFVPVMVVTGTLVTLEAVRNGRVPFFFQPQHFLLADIATLLAFAGLFAAAITMRGDTGWHARLHICAFMALMGPGLGRILPMPFLIPWGFEVAALVPLAVAAIGAARDWRKHGRPHPAWAWGAGALVLAVVLARVVGFSPAGAALYAQAVAGSAAEGSNGLAFPPFPPGLSPPPK